MAGVGRPGRLAGAADGDGVRGEQLGRWVAAQRGVFSDVEHEQQDLLVAIDIEEDPVLA
ncbi:hypothetical protein ACFV1L_24420 [Kitasatospora sp. NPDC059646]|uniref:hypothetical protein n=1 Tax=Kitasatospora sp. NPDC059646 TaxID=3346893 RepID=UPI00367AD801